MRPEHWARPTRRGVGALVAGVIAALAGYLLSSLPLVFAGVALAALVVTSLVSVSMRAPRIQLARRFTPDRAVAGWSVVETLFLSVPPGFGSVSLRVRETVGWRVMRSFEAVVVTVEAGSGASVSFPYDDLPRGRQRIGPARIDMVESFGLATRLVIVPGTAELLVFPEVVSLGHGRESRSLGEGTLRRRDHTMAASQDDPVTREYRRGDAMRRVHWRATARQGELMVRQEEQHALPSARVVLPVRSENWQDAHPALGSRLPVSNGFEWAVSAAASIAYEFGKAGSQTRVVGLDGSTISMHDPSSAALFLENMADLTLDAVVGDRSPEPSPREPVVAVVSTLSPPEIEALGRLRGAGVTGVAIVVHVDGGVVTPGDAGARSLADVAATLRDTGWLVIETDSTADPSEVLSTPGMFGG